MKRPEYIELTLPGRKGTFSLATKRYFRRLEGKIIKVHFGEYRVKKEFQYKIFKSGFEEFFSYWPRRKHTTLKIAFRIEKQPEPEKTALG